MSYETNKYIPTYALIREEKEKKRLEELEKERNEIFWEIYSYYRDNYPKSEKGHEYTNQKVDLKFKEGMSIKEAIIRFTEDELYSLFDISEYFRKEKKFAKVSKYDVLQSILVMTKKTIPGGKYIEKIRKLKNKMNKDLNQLKEWEKNVAEEQKKFREEQAKNQQKENEIIDKNIEEEQNDFHRCIECGKICKTAGGLASHLKIHEKKE